MTLPITKPKPFCFVLMPFDAAFIDIYEYGIKGACSEVDVYCERVGEQNDRITSKTKLNFVQ